MAKHLKKYDSVAELSGITKDLQAPFVAYAPNPEGESGATVIFSSDAKQALFNTLTGEELLNLLFQKMSREVYLSENEYQKLVAGEEAIDLYGEVITTAWDYINVTYYVYEDNIINDLQDVIMDDESYLNLGDFGYYDEDGYLELDATMDEDGYLVFNTSNSQDDIFYDEEDGTMDGFEVDEEGYLIVPDNTLNF